MLHKLMLHKLTYLFATTIMMTMVACQLDPMGVNTHKGEVDVTLAVMADEATTRGASNAEQGASSACGAIDFFEGTDWDSVDLRYTLEVYDRAENYEDAVPVKNRMVKIVDSYEAVNFDMRLASNRNYRFVVFADFVADGSAELDDEAKLTVSGLYHTIGETLKEIEINDEAINDEATDAYFIAENLLITDNSHHSLVLRRPYGKIRVITTDLAEVNNNLVPSHIVVRYTATKPEGINAVTGEITEWTSNEQIIEADIAPRSYYTEGYDKLQNNGKYTHMTLFTDYILASAEGATPIHFSIEVQDGNGETMTTTVFDTDIPIERNHLTTIIGNMLTTASEVNVTIDDNFSNHFTVDEHGNPVTPDDGGNNGEGSDDDDDDDNNNNGEGGTTPPVVVRPASVQLPAANIIKELLRSMQHVKFVAKSDRIDNLATRSITIIELGEDIWAVKDDTTMSIEFHTFANEFVADNDLNTIFARNTTLRDIDFDDSFNTEAVTTLDGAFSGCSNLTAINFESFDTSNVTSMTDMLGDCKKLAEVDLTPLETNGVTSLSRMFRNCTIEVIDLRNMDTSNVTDMSQMFIDSSIETIIFGGKFNTSKVTTMNSMFCRTTISTLDLRSFDTSSLKDMDDMFNGCTATSIDLSSFDTSNVTVMRETFRNASNLTTIDLSSFNTSALKRATGLFRGCTSLKSLDLSNFNTENVEKMDYMFYNCGALESIIFGENFKVKNVDTMSFMFYHCTSLTSIDVSNWGEANRLYHVNNLFNGCTSLTEFDATGFIAKPTDMGYMFYGCTNITSINLSSFIRTGITRYEKMMCDCVHLEEAIIPNFDLSNFVDLDNVTGNTGRSAMFKNAGSQTSNGCNIYVNEVSYRSITEKNAGGYDPTYHHFRTPSGELWDDVINNDATETEDETEA